MGEQKPAFPEANRGPLLLTFRQAAEECACSYRSIQRAVKDGELKVVNAPGTIGHKGKRIPFQALEAWLKKQLGV